MPDLSSRQNIFYHVHSFLNFDCNLVEIQIKIPYLVHVIIHITENTSQSSSRHTLLMYTKFLHLPAVFYGGKYQVNYGHYKSFPPT